VARWAESGDDPEARFQLARVRLSRFYADRGREQGKQALSSLEEALRELPEDARVQRAKLDFLMRIGAWQEARDQAARCLTLEPGELELEGRYRTLVALAEGAPGIDQALYAVEKSGRFANEGEGLAPRVSTGSVQPLLRELAAQPDVKAALYVRGSTALVQGPKGATAERTARAVQSILASSRAAGRKLGLGTVFQIQVEGSFGTLSIAPGEQDAGALLCAGPLGRSREEALLGLAGLNAETGEGESP
jgi:predicted regulator of Ras-like GTPase activity (Roadblock/LC7/MglB family)